MEQELDSTSTRRLQIRSGARRTSDYAVDKREEEAEVIRSLYRELMQFIEIASDMAENVVEVFSNPCLFSGIS